MTRPTIPRRLVDQQRRLRQAGRIRTGYSEAVPGKKHRRPVKSPTFILTSQQRSDLELAAQRWGGDIDRWQPQGGWPEEWRLMTDTDTIEALLPPGDPLTSLYEFWTGPRCVRRCDSVTEYIGDPNTPGQPRPCVCAAMLGPDWQGRELPEQDKRNACKLTTRLNVFLPLEDFAYWRLDVHSWFGAAEMTGIVDLIKERIGPTHEVPIRLRIEQRSLPGKDFQVVAIEVRSQVARQILAGVAPEMAVEGDTTPRQAIGSAGPAAIPGGHEDGQSDVQNQPAAPVNDSVSAGQPPSPEQEATDTPADIGRDGWVARIEAASTLDELRALWKPIGDAGHMDQGMKGAFWARRAALTDSPPPSSSEPEPAAVVEAQVAAADAEAEVEPNREAMWGQTLRLAADRGWDTPTVSAKFRDTIGKDAAAGDGWDHAIFLENLQKDRVT